MWTRVEGILECPSSKSEPESEIDLFDDHEMFCIMMETSVKFSNLLLHLMEIFWALSNEH